MYWTNNSVTLRKLNDSDFESLYQAKQNTDFERVFEPGIQDIISKDDYYEYFINSIKRPYNFGIENDNGDFVGMCKISYTDLLNGTFGITILILEQFQKQGYAKNSLNKLLDFGFNELRLNKCNSETIDMNISSINLHLSLGFKEEGIRRETVYTDGKYHDEILFGLTKGEFNKK